MFCTFRTNEGSNILGFFTVVHCFKGILKSKRLPSRLPNQQNTKHHLQPSQDRYVTTVARLSAIGVKTKVLTAIRMEPIGEFYSKWKAIEALENGYVCIFSAGTGSPYFTTDTGSSLRGIEIEADVMLKGTRVDGVYTADPEKDPQAEKFTKITYKEVLQRGLKVMDLTAICMCQDNHLPIYVFNMDVVGNLKKVLDGEEIGTLVY